ncbi:hypothetical protein GOV14_04440 [Candidatus Pacearchaeota archaeon]|nr:hypothetical protein [Candidatus Pacearchaeota archaeon]
MKVNKKLVISQLLFVVLALSFVFFMYPRTSYVVSGNVVLFDSGNVNVIMISKDSGFANPIYYDLTESGRIRLDPGHYYWKPINGFIKGFAGEFEIDSNAALSLDRGENETSLVNVGNVKLNVTKQGTSLVGHIVLDPSDSDVVEDKGVYTGGQAE